MVNGVEKHEGPHELITDWDKLRAILAMVSGQLEEIKRHFAKDELPIEMQDGDPGGTVGSITLKPVVNAPFIATRILATWPVAATGVTLTLGDRVIELPPALGIFNPEIFMQISHRDICKLTVTPAGPCYFSIMGYADYRKID